MRLCVREHRATHFALLTAIMSLSFTFAGAASGYIAEAVGYQTYFVFTFVATLPMMILGALVPIEGSSAHDMASAGEGAA
jgi:PAT family beta-lactamase induction signal transducer AmpG